MAEIINGLFGIDPAQYQQQQLVKQSNANMQLAQMDPLQARRYALMQAGTDIGNAGMGLLGIQDPMLQQATELKQIASQFDTTTPKGLIQLAQAIKDKYPQQAQQAVAAAQKMQLDAASVYQKTGENLNALIASGKYTPESLSKFQQTRNAGDLVLAVTPEKMGDTAVKEVATAEKNNNILTSTNKKLDSWLTEVETGKIEFGLGTRIGAQYERARGTQSANTQKLDSLNKFLETERNNILMAAKGTQTEGDADRAMKQIMSNTDFNNAASVAQALKDLKAYKETQIEGNKVYIDSLRGTRKIGGSSAPSSPTAPSAPATGEYADDYKKYVATYGNVMPYAAYAAKRKQAGN